MAVLPEYQNQKVGHLLMEAAISYGKKLQLQMKLEVHNQNDLAYHLYRKYGFYKVTGGSAKSDRWFCKF